MQSYLSIVLASPAQDTPSPLLLRRPFEIRVHATQMVVDVVLLFLFWPLEITFDISFSSYHSFFAPLSVPSN